MWLNLVPVAVVAVFAADWLLVRPKVFTVRESHDKVFRLTLSLILMVYSWTLPKAFALGMTLSFAGDMILASVPFLRDIVKAARFPLGMFSFAAAHVFYTLAFTGTVGWSALRSDGRWLVVFTLLQIMGVALWYTLVYDPKFKERILLAGALVYSAFICTMASTAVSTAVAAGSWWILSTAGAVSFIISDLLLGGGELTLKLKIPDCSQYVWFTYLLAQSLILLGAALAI